MSTQLSLVLSGVFCLILASSAQEACRLDAAMTVHNDESKFLTPFLFRGSGLYQVFVEDNSPGELIKGKEFLIKYFWRNWTEEKVTWTMTWFDYYSKQAVAIIGNLKTTHLIRFNEKNTLILDTYKTWNKNLLVDVNGNSPSRAVLISHFQPGYLWMYHENTKKASWKLVDIDSSGTVSRPFRDKTNEKNPLIEPWLNRIVASNLTIIGVLKTWRNQYCRGTVIPLFGCFEWRLMVFVNVVARKFEHIPIPWDWEESVVVFIEHDKQTRHCFGKFRHDSEACSSIGEFQLTNMSFFGCGKKGDLRSTVSTTIRTKPIESSTSKIEPPTDDRRRNGIDWFMMSLYAILIIVMLVVGCLCISLRKEKDPHHYELLKETKKKTKKEKKKKKGTRSSSKFKPRRAKDVKLFGSSDSESAKTV